MVCFTQYDNITQYNNKINCTRNLYNETCLIRHTKGPGKCVGLYRMSQYTGFISVNRNTSFILFGWNTSQSK